MYRCYRPGRGLYDLKKCFVPHGIGGEAAHVGRCASVSVGVQSVRRDKIGLGHADFRCFCVHHRGESFHAAADVFRDRYGGIIVGFQHQGV